MPSTQAQQVAYPGEGIVSDSCSSSLMPSTQAQQVMDPGKDVVSDSCSSAVMPSTHAHPDEGSDGDSCSSSCSSPESDEMSYETYILSEVEKIEKFACFALADSLDL